MKYLLLPFFKERACLVLLAMTIGGCATKPPPVAPALSAPQPTMALEKHHVEAGGDVSVDYQIERKISSANGVSCYAFITGTLNNDSNQVLGRRTVLDFIFYSGAKQSFRDLTYPLKDAPPGSRTQFEMVVSPVHKEGCVHYDRITVSVRKVVVNRADY
jgi:hypothetical protein